MNNIFKQISKIIKENENIIIIAHKGIDLDAIGSSLALYKIIESYDKKPFIFINNMDQNVTIKKSVEKLYENNIQINFINEKNLTNYNDDNTLVIILDTNKRDLLEYPEILNIYSKRVIIDHHIKNNSYIADNKIVYINNDVSSVCEIMVNYLKYTNVTIHPIIATIMLAGIEVDTNGFNLKTSSETFETASYLIKMGANNVEKQKLLKENKENYCKRQDFVKKSYMINKNMALCLMDEKIYKRYELALISEDLLQFDDVEASFTIGYIEKNVVGISARSIGEVDVEKIMEKMGGGGHKTDAASCIENASIKEVKENLIKNI